MSRSGQPSRSLGQLAAPRPLKATAERLSAPVAEFCRTLIREAHPFDRYAGDPAAETPLREPA